MGTVDRLLGFLGLCLFLNAAYSAYEYAGHAKHTGELIITVPFDVKRIVIYKSTTKLYSLDNY